MTPSRVQPGSSAGGQFAAQAHDESDVTLDSDLHHWRYGDLEVEDVRDWARWETQSHVPQDDTYGVTCDERGCLFCNAGDEDEAVDAVMWSIRNGSTPCPGPQEVEDARAEMKAGSEE